MSPKRSLLLRSCLALALMAGFYALAFAMLAGLGFLAYEVIAAGRYGLGTVKVLLFCGIGMITIAIALFPRREEFRPPGPLLLPGEFPDLFAAIGDIAAKAGQAMPREVYLLPDMNAFVMERGGFPVAGRTRILGVGLPLLQALTVAELRGVLAHEFGHFHGGDTAIGPWIHRIRAAMARTLQGLERQSAILRKPFEWYGILFLRVSLAVSRAQEYAADRLAARLAGLGPTVSGLKKVHALAPVSEAYWSQEVGPAVGKGYRPRLAEGFQAYVRTPRVREALPTILESVLKEDATSPYDSHPCLKDRLSALGAGGADAAAAPFGPAEKGESALRLLPGHERLEPALFGCLLGIDPEGLRPLAWEDSGESVHRPQLEDFLKPFADRLAPLRFREYPDHFARPGEVAERLKAVGGVPEEPEEQKAFIAHILEAHLILSLCTRGWTLRSRPGEALECRPGAGGADMADGFAFGTIRKELAEGAITPAQWAERCRVWNLE